MKMMFSAAAAAVVLVVSAPLALSDEAPEFMRDTFPEAAVQPAWEEFQAVMSDADLDAKTKELVALAIAAQVPCTYCVYYHTRAAESQGATDAEIREALAAAALVRKWSTMLNGSQYDEDEWQRQVDEMFDGS